MKVIKNIIDKLGGRKIAMWSVLFFSSVVMYVLSATHLNAEQIDFKDWSDFNLTLFLYVIAGNVGEHVADKFGKK